MRRAFTAIELLTALTVLAVVLALVARAATGHERLQRTLANSRAGARAAQQAVAIVAASLAPLAPDDIDPMAISDSAVEFLAFVGGAVGCVSGAYVHVGAASDTGAGLTSFVLAPAVGDRVVLLDESTDPPQWTPAAIDGVTSGGLPCAAAGPADGQTLRLNRVPGAGPLVALRVLRRTRFNLYRSGDGDWYLGMREWNAGAGRFNGLQPVAGPLAPYSADPARTGLRLTVVDADGREMPFPSVLAAGARTVRVTARSRDAADSAARVVGLRNAP